MAHVKFTQALRRFYPDLKPLHLEGSTIAEIVQGLEDKYPGLKDYIVDEHGQLRKHVNIFIQNSLIKDRTHLQDKITDQDEIYIMQALSGG